MVKNKSAIGEAKEQLYLDTADDSRLDSVTQNLGLTRPLFSSYDAKWRAITKELALQKKQVKPIFDNLLDVLVGPQYSKGSDLAVAASIGEDNITVNDASVFPQIGTIILDSGLGSQETINYILRDIAANKLYLEGVLTQNHIVRDSGSAVLRLDTTIGATSLFLFDSSTLPTTHYSYPIILDQGTTNEEIVLVSNNNTTTGILTVSATTKAHKGLQKSFLQKQLGVAAKAGQDFVILKSDNIGKFPASGYIGINANTTTGTYPGTYPDQATYYYDDADYINNTLKLLRFTATSYTINTPVDLLIPGATITTASVFEQGIYWDIYQTATNKVNIYIPSTYLPNDIFNASYIHDAVPAVLATTTVTAVSLPTITVVSTASFPDVGMITIGAQHIFYKAKDDTANTFTLVYQTTPTIVVTNVVTQYEVPHAGTLVEDGNLRTSAGVMQSYRYPGPYIYNINERAPGFYKTTLNTYIPNTLTSIEVSSLGSTNITVDDAFGWSIGQSVAIDPKTGSSEDNIILLIYRNITFASTLSNNQSIGDTIVNVPLSPAFPDSGGHGYAGYKIVIAKGTVGEEEVLVLDFDSGTGDLTLSTPLTKAHLAGDAVNLTGDVVSLTTPTLYNHSLNTKITPYVSQLTLTSGAGFPTDKGVVLLNFGKGIVNSKSKLVSKPSATVYAYTSTAHFPTTNYPYIVKLSAGTTVEESIRVSNNNTGTNRLTFSTTPVNTHVAGRYTTFVSGDQETLDYTSRLGNIIYFSTPILLDTKHNIGESLTSSPAISQSRKNGWGFGLKIPYSLQFMWQSFLDSARAAGIEVIISRNLS